MAAQVPSPLFTLVCPNPDSNKKFFIFSALGYFSAVTHAPQPLLLVQDHSYVNSRLIYSRFFVKAMDSWGSRKIR